MYDMSKVITYLHNEELEQAVLGEILKDSSLYSDIEQYPKELFYSEKHQEIYWTMKRLANEGKEIEVITVCDYLKNSKVGISYVMNLFNGVATTAHFQTHVNTLIDYYNKRKIFQTVSKIDFANDSDKITNELNTALTSVLEQQENTQPTSEYLFSYIEEMYNPKPIESIKFGLDKIDDETGGIKPGQMITIAAYTGVGKSIVTCQIMLNMLRKNKKIALFSLEMSREEIVNKFVSNGCAIEATKVNKKELMSEKEKEKALAFITQFLATKHFEIYAYVEDIDKIIKQIKLEKKKNNIDIVFLDLINRVSESKNKTANRAEFISSLTRRLKVLAGQLQIPIVITAQINRMVEQRQDKAPTLSDIKESGGIAEDSDLVLGLYRDKRLEDAQYREQMKNKGDLNLTAKDATVNPNCIEIHILKGRNVPASKKAFRWVPEYQMIMNFGG